VLLVMIKKEIFYNVNEINLFTAVVVCAAAFCLLLCVPISPSLTLGCTAENVHWSKV
jgi:hypothetical protein